MTEKEAQKEVPKKELEDVNKITFHFKWGGRQTAHLGKNLVDAAKLARKFYLHAGFKIDVFERESKVRALANDDGPDGTWETVEKALGAHK